MDSRGIVWTVGHAIYENNFARKLVSPIVNLFKPDWVMVGNNKMYIDKNHRVVSAELILSGVWEEFETEIFKKHLRAGDTVLDIGANIGYHTLIAAELVGPNGKVYSFEPDPKNFQLLKKSVEANGYTNVTLEQIALANKNGQGKLFLSNEDNYGDLRIFDSQDKRASTKIRLVTLDTYFKDKNPQIDVIKMDVQGSEALVLKGALQTLKKNKHLKLFTEFWPKALRLSGSSATDYFNLLTKSGFKIFAIDVKHKHLTKVTLKKLLADYSEDSQYNADLLCLK